MDIISFMYVVISSSVDCIFSLYIGLTDPESLTPCDDTVAARGEIGLRGNSAQDTNHVGEWLAIFIGLVTCWIDQCLYH